MDKAWPLYHWCVVCLISPSKCQPPPTSQPRPSHPCSITASAARPQQMCASPQLSHPRCIKTCPAASHRCLIFSKRKIPHRVKQSKRLKIQPSRTRQAYTGRGAHSNSRSHWTSSIGLAWSGSALRGWRNFQACFKNASVNMQKLLHETLQRHPSVPLHLRL